MMKKNYTKIMGGEREKDKESERDGGRDRK